MGKPKSDFYCAADMDVMPDNVGFFRAMVWYDHTATEYSRDSFEVTLDTQVDGERATIALDFHETVELVDALVRALSGDHPYEVEE